MSAVFGSWKNKRTQLITAALAAVLAPAVGDAFVRECKNKDAGEWNFGAAPAGCDASLFGDVPRVRLIYKDMIFDRTNSDPDERTRYTTQLYAMIREVASDYLRRREPDATDAEIEAWVHAVLSVGTQETFLSHYRVGLDSRLKLMTGDRVISHGIMQINQKFHGARGQDNSFDLIGNLLYGIDHYYLEFSRAKRAGCIARRPKNEKIEARYEALSRAAYAAYNGGPVAVCRWTNPRHPWAKNDKGFHAKYKTAPWKEYVQDPKRPSPIKTRCLIDGDDMCALSKEDQVAYTMARPLVYDDGSTCFMAARDLLNCAKDLRTFQCLNLLDPEAMEATPLKLKARDPRMRVRWVSDRDSLCRAAVPGLAKIGDIVKIKKQIRVRKSVGGPVVQTLKAGALVQVVDYDIKRDVKNERYYRVHLGKTGYGYIFAGTDEDKSWVEVVPEIPAGRVVPLAIPRKGSTIEIVRADGVNILKDTRDGAFVIGDIAARTQLTVGEIVVRHTSNEIYLKLESDSGNGKGFVYVGRTYPDVTVGEWVKIVP